MSKIELHPSLQVAHNVIKKLEKILPSKYAKTSMLKSWSNGREQGLCLLYYNPRSKFNNNLKICIAESRCSDDILIVMGPANQFCFQTNQPSENVWNNRVCFDYNQPNKAAKFIKKAIINYLI